MSLGIYDKSNGEGVLVSFNLEDLLFPGEKNVPERFIEEWENDLRRTRYDLTMLEGFPMRYEDGTWRIVIRRRGNIMRVTEVREEDGGWHLEEVKLESVNEVYRNRNIICSEIRPCLLIIEMNYNGTKEKMQILGWYFKVEDPIYYATTSFLPLRRVFRKDESKKMGDDIVYVEELPTGKITYTIKFLGTSRKDVDGIYL